MFAYLSALVELDYFDEIYANFLIVGHTHGADDQYFSVLAKKISWARFIGSPLSFEELLKIAHSDQKDRPFLVKRISIIYDVMTALKPFVNSTVKYFQVRADLIV